MNYRLLLIGILLVIVLMGSVINDAIAGSAIAEIFSPISWGMKEKDIRRSFSGYTVKKYKQDTSAVDARGRLLKGTMSVIVVENVKLDNIFPADIYFSRIKGYRYIDIESVQRWSACDPRSDENKDICESETRQIRDIYQNVVVKLNKAFGMDGRLSDKTDPEYERDEVYTWNYNGFEIYFGMYVEETTSYLSIFIRMQE